MAARTRPGDPAVSSVVGTVLMLGITIAVFAGFSLFVLSDYAEGEEQLHADLGVVREGGNVLLRHQGGEAVDLAEGRLLFSLDGTATEIPLSDLAGQTADGQSWRIGESLCLSGPSPPCHYDGAEVTGVRLVHANTIVLADTAPVAATGSTVTYVSSQLPTPGSLGSVAALSAAQSASDGGAAATLMEEAVVGAAGAGSATLSGSTVSANSATNPGNVLAGALSGDGSNARALLDANGDWVQVTGFDVPAGATGVTAVTMGFEGRVESTGGTRPQVQLSYTVGASAGPTALTQTLSSTSDAQFPRTITGDRAWTVADLEAMSLRIEVVNSPNRVAGIDHVYLTVQYTTAPATTYALRIDLEVADAADGADTAVLELAYRTAGDSFQVEVWDGAAYVARGTQLSSATMTSWSHTLTPAEFNGGSPRLRLVDLTPTGSTQGTLFLDYVRVVAS